MLQDSRTRVGIVPELGGGIAFMEALLPGRRDVPVLRRWTHSKSDGPFALACNVLVPFSNRISGGGFTFRGAFHAIAPNLAGEGFPIHGDGFQRAWAIEMTSGEAASLTLGNGQIGPFRYGARQLFHLEDGALHVEVVVTNETSGPLPFGAGFHPWFPRFAGTTLRFRASDVWLEDTRHLPTELVDVAARPQWDFSAARPLPKAWINNAFTGWLGAATISQPGLHIAIDIEASPNLDVAVVYSPGPDADFFCFEPVSHAVDAYNLPGRPGLTVLERGQSLHAAMTLRWSPL
ncbi:aldose 1-epimerase [Mesorhizobium sp.]|uniref:aldose 1-epimerase n=1 Tax=Mesorhizobium sp. TaxID=1871066 RepID=UPI0025B7E1F4|nr:aldose 1-epimerase [Mesorhizobium sp.]